LGALGLAATPQTIILRPFGMLLALLMLPPHLWGRRSAR
tara:strand:+ start:822 stop:938 length:117 start_codon:yes stop_codon:yes gene_type:complete